MKKIIFTIRAAGFFCMLFTLCFGATTTRAQDSTKREVPKAAPVGFLKDTIRLPWNTQISQKYYTGSASYITGEEMSRFKVTNNSNMLAGRLPGLVTSMGSEEPGYDGSTLFIRGSNNYNFGTAYNLYIDNAPFMNTNVFFSLPFSAFSQLDPLEIDQVAILKDAAANGSYGIYGGNKSLFVTTKRGIAGVNKINFYSQFGYVMPTEAPNFLGAKEYMTLYNEAAVNDGSPVRFTPADIAQYDNPARNQQLYPDVNWYDALVKDRAAQQKYGLTFLGGNEAVKYFVLLGLTDQAGLFKGTDQYEETLGFNSNTNFTRYNFRTNLDFAINPSLTVALDLAGRLERKNFPGTGTGTIWEGISGYPPNLFPVVYADGKIGGNQQYQRNPYGQLTQTGFIREVHRNLLGTTRITQDLNKWVKGLSVTGALSYYNFNQNNEGASMNFASYQLQPDGVTFSKFGTDATYTARTPRFQVQDRNVSFWAKADYASQFGENHNVDANIGYYQMVRTPAGNDFPYARQGFFGRFNYRYKQKYIAELNLSYSGSENLPPGSRFGVFPAVSGAWLISEEDFLKDTKTDLLKLRASYGIMGNADFGLNLVGLTRYPYAGGYGTGLNYTFGRNPGVVGSRTEGLLPNPDITWEKIHMTNIGVDAAFFNERIGATINLFNERRTDILAFPSTLSSLIGVSFKPRNIGEVTNKGADWDLFYKDKIGEFAFALHALGSYTKNNIVEQNEALQPYDYLYRTGRSIGTPFGLEAIGFFSSQAEINASPTQSFGPVRPGDLKYKDQNGDNRIDQFDQIALGNPSTPQLYYGANLDLKFKGFDFTIWFQGTGNRNINIMNQSTMGFAANSKPTDYVLNRWTPTTATTATYPRLSVSAKNGENNYTSSTFWIKNGRYLRLKNIELGYSFGSSLLSKVHLKQARVYVSGFNVHTWTQTGAEYIDPEFTQAGISNYPRTRSFQIGLNVGL